MSNVEGALWHLAAYCSLMRASVCCSASAAKTDTLAKAWHFEYVRRLYIPCKRYLLYLWQNGLQLGGQEGDLL